MQTLKWVCLVLVLFGVVENVQASDRRVLIVNNTNSSMMRFYASNVGRGSWEENIFRGGRLLPGTKVMVDINDGSGYCMFDLKAVFADGDVVMNRRFNVCEEIVWEIYE